MKKLMSITAALFVTFGSLSAYALAASDNNKTITRIGTQNGVAYVGLSPALTIGPSGTCQFDIVYIADVGTPAGKAFYATLLTAYSQGKPLSRIDYSNSTSGTFCYVSLIEVQ